MEAQVRQKDQDLSQSENRKDEMLETIIQLKTQLEQKELELNEATTRLEQIVYQEKEEL